MACIHCRHTSLLVVVLLGLLDLSLTQAADGQPPSHKEIVDSVRTNEEQILRKSKSLEIVYSRVRSDDITPTKKSGGQFLMEWHIARNRPDEWFSRATYRQKTSRKGISLPTDPITIMTRGGMYLEWRGGRQDCFIDSANKTTDFFQGWQYLQYLGFDAYRAIARTTWSDFATMAAYLEKYDDPILFEFNEPYIVESMETEPSEYNIRPYPEFVNGVKCWVVEWPGMHKFWVDPVHGFAVHRRIIHWGLGKPIKRKIECSDFREVKPGLWLPFRLVVDNYAKIRAEDEQLWGSVANRSTLQVERIDFDRNLNELYTVDLPAGIMVNDFARGLEYRVPPSGGDPFEKPLEMGRDQLKKPRNRMFLIVNSLLGICVLIMLIVRWRRAAKTAGIVCIALASANVAFSEQLVVDRHTPKSSVSTSHISKTDDSSVSSRPQEICDEWTSWKPFWRSKHDCGPNSLFVLLQLLNKEVTTTQTHELIPIDPKYGCSMEDLRRAAGELGVDCEVRFVSNKAFHNLRFPVILHGNASVTKRSGHFTVIVDRDPNNGRYAVIDTVSEKFAWYPEKSVLYGYSGYVLVAKRSSGGKWVAVAVLILGVLCQAVPPTRWEVSLVRLQDKWRCDSSSD